MIVSKYRTVLMSNHPIGMSRRMYLYLYLIWLPWQASGQAFSVCHFDRPFYFTGENIHFHFYSNQVSGDSAVMQFGLLDSSGSVVHSHFVILKSSRVSSYMQLDLDLAPGLYDFRAWVFDGNAQSHSIQLFSRKLSILSEAKFSPSHQLICDEHSALHSDDRISISFPDEIKMRSQNTCVLEGGLALADKRVSISVREQFLETPLSTVFSSEGGWMDDVMSNGIPIYGYLNNATSIMETSMIYCLDASSLSVRYHWVKGGMYLIKYPLFWGVRKFAFHSWEEKPELLRIDDSSNFPPGNCQGIEVDQRWGQDLRERRKIYNMFSSLEEKVVFKEIENMTKEVEPDFVVDVQDYDVRGKVNDLLKEISLPLKFRLRNRDEVRAQMLYETQGLKYFYDAPTIFVVNNQFTIDASYIAQLLLQDLKRIDIYSTLRTVRHKMKLVDIGGLVQIETVDPLFTLPDSIRFVEEERHGLQFPIKYPVEIDTDSQLPQLPVLVFWQPELTFDNTGELSFQLPIGDHYGSYLIEVTCHEEKTFAQKSFVVGRSSK